MNEHAVRLLDFPVILAELAGYAWSEDGRRGIRGQSFLTDAEDLEALRLPVSEFRRLFNAAADAPSLSFPDIGESAVLAEKPGSVLEAGELGSIGSYLRQCGILKNFIKRDEGILKAEAGDLPDLSGLAGGIAKIIDGEGNIRENDIPSLADIRRRIRACRRDLEGLASSYLGNNEFRGFWQSDTPSQKDGRMVLPLAANFKGRIRGVVHEISSRGATAFFEPLDIFEKNNQIVEEENEYRREVLRILRELTAEVRARVPEIRYLMGRIAVIDGWQARARYSHFHECFTAGISDGEMLLNGARHPLLGKKAVPIDVGISGNTRILLITGPNTGGKTVALKTVGLLALMNQFGLDLPAGMGSVLPVFDDVYADIGDEQSIAESLSTFSAHAGNMAAIVKECTSRSLVLLDELGAGTDPEQGSALAMSFLDRFLDKGVLAVVTTHLGTLKQYAYTHPGTANASVDFDTDLLKPTYRIIQGVPGASHALEIAERCGVPREIISEARKYIEDGETDSGRLIRNLTEQQKELEDRNRELERLRRETEAAKKRLEERENEVLEKEFSLRREGIRETSRFLDESRKEMEKLVREFRQGEVPRETAMEIKSFVDGVKEHLLLEQEKARKSKPRRRTPFTVPLTEGMEVLVGEHRRRGVLERKLKNGRWLVGTGAVRITVTEEDLQPAAPSKTGIDVTISLQAEGGKEPAKFELDLRGLRTDEALHSLEKQTDRAIVQGLQEFGIIHGKGEGILQKAVWEYLKSCPAVADFSFAVPEAGGSGKTLVRLKG